MHNACTITKLSASANPLTHPSPSPTEVSPRVPCLREPLAATGLPPAEDSRASKSSRSTTYSYSRCVKCVYYALADYAGHYAMFLCFLLLAIMLWLGYYYALLIGYYAWNLIINYLQYDILLTDFNTLR